VNAFLKSQGDVVLVAGATSGGAALVVKPEIHRPADLRGKKLSSPQLGGTQDVALRSWLKDNDLATDTSGGGDVSIVPQDNAATLDAFKAGQIDGAWLPEPWATRLIVDGGGKVLVDEADLWPGGRFVTTHLIVAKTFLDAHPDAVRRLIEGEQAAIELISAQPAVAQQAANDQIEAITGKRLRDDVIAAAWKHLTFTLDPIASSLKTSAEHATAVGLLDEVDLGGIYDLSILDKVLADHGLPAVNGL
jgi:NitT/TauT family transport system substrate-binding protein